MRRQLLILWLALALMQASVCRAQRERSIGIDTTLVVLRVWNYRATAVMVYLELPTGELRRVSEVPPAREGYFVIPSREIKKLLVFAVVVVSADSLVPPYRTGAILRNPRKITMVFTAVGQPTPADTTTRAPGVRS